MDLNNMITMIDRMQDNQFKKHALWILQMKQSFMITKVKN